MRVLKTYVVILYALAQFVCGDPQRQLKREKAINGQTYLLVLFKK